MNKKYCEKEEKKNINRNDWLNWTESENDEKNIQRRNIKKKIAAF